MEGSKGDNEKGEGNTGNGVREKHSMNMEDKAPYPICWFEDEDTGKPLRWHLFAGVL